MLALAVLLQAGVSQYDDQGRLGEMVEVYLPAFLRKLIDYRIKSECGKHCSQVFLSKSAFVELCEKTIQPQDSESQPNE